MPRLTRTARSSESNDNFQLQLLGPRSLSRRRRNTETVEILGTRKVRNIDQADGAGSPARRRLDCHEGFSYDQRRRCRLVDGLFVAQVTERHREKEAGRTASEVGDSDGGGRAPSRTANLHVKGDRRDESDTSPRTTRGPGSVGFSGGCRPFVRRFPKLPESFEVVRPRGRCRYDWTTMQVDSQKNGRGSDTGRGTGPGALSLLTAQHH